MEVKQKGSRIRAALSQPMATASLNKGTAASVPRQRAVTKPPDCLVYRSAASTAARSCFGCESAEVWRMMAIIFIAEILLDIVKIEKSIVS